MGEWKEANPMMPGQPMQPGAPAAATVAPNMTTPGMPQVCPVCGQPHAPGTPCPASLNTNVFQPAPAGAYPTPASVPQQIVTKAE